MDAESPGSGDHFEVFGTVEVAIFGDGGVVIEAPPAEVEVDPLL
jgi:hypothetical protein